MYECEEEQAIQAEQWNLPVEDDCSCSFIARSIQENKDTTNDVPKGKRKVKVHPFCPARAGEKECCKAGREDGTESRVL